MEWMEGQQVSGRRQMGGTLCGGGGVRSSSLKYEDKAELLADFPNCGAVSP